MLGQTAGDRHTANSELCWFRSPTNWCNASMTHCHCWICKFLSQNLEFLIYPGYQTQTYLFFCVNQILMIRTLTLNDQLGIYRAVLSDVEQSCNNITNIDFWWEQIVFHGKIEWNPNSLLIWLIGRAVDNPSHIHSQASNICLIYDSGLNSR